MNFKPEVFASWDKFLNPDTLKQNLVAAGLYLVAFEMLKKTLIGKPRDFFWEGFREGKEVIGVGYETKVLSLHKHRYTASALWWKVQGAINDADVSKLGEIREHRDQIAHDLPEFIGTGDRSIRLELLTSTHEILFKMDNWWIREIEVPTDPDFDQRTVSDEELNRATSMNSILLSLLLPVAAGDDTSLRSIYESWMAVAEKWQSGAAQNSR